MRPAPVHPVERRRRRGGAAVALVVLVAFVGVGVALVLAAGVLGLGVTLVAYRSGGVASLRAPGVVLALGAELIAAALLVGWRVGARIPTEEDEGNGPVAG